MPRSRRPPATTEVRWLDADQQHAWRALVVTAEWLQQGLDRQLQRDAGVTHAQYALLVALSEAPNGMMPMSELAQAYDHSLSRLSHAVRRMESVGWSRGRPAPPTAASRSSS